MGEMPDRGEDRELGSVSFFFYPGMNKVQITEEDICFKKRKKI